MESPGDPFRMILVLAECSSADTELRQGAGNQKNREYRAKTTRIPSQKPSRCDLQEHAGFVLGVQQARRSLDEAVVILYVSAGDESTLTTMHQRRELR
jgi:hypothetical protein